MRPLYCILLLGLSVHASVNCAIGALAKLIHPEILAEFVVLASHGLLLLLLLLRRCLLVLLLLGGFDHGPTNISFQIN